MKDLLIVGCGDIGRRAVPLLAASWQVSGLARSADAARMLEALNVEPVHGDLDQPESLTSLAGRSWHAVLHCAPPQRSGREDLRTRNLLAALEGAIVPRRFVYLSTTGVYGDSKADLVLETNPLRPQTDRAWRRVDAERQLETWCASRAVSLAVLRVPGIYADDRLPIERLRNATPALRPEDDVFTNHIHADDLAAIAAEALDRTDARGVFNTVDDSRIRMGDYFDLVADRHGLPRPPRAPRAEVLARVSPELASFMCESRWLSNQRMKEVLGVRLRYPTVYEGIREAVR
jgi:nucleoside-diphosphate-sugar epimerase